MNADFFRINFPYGITKQSDGKWMAFNRDFRLLPHRDEKQLEDQLPVSGDIRNINEELLVELADDTLEIQRDENQNIRKFFLYSDNTNPITESSQDPELWKKYCYKMKKILV